MAITREKKDTVIKELTDTFEKGTAAVFVNFHGLSVSDTNALRRKLRAEGVSYKVAKKTLIEKALSTRTFSGTKPEFVGEVAVSVGVDAVAPAKGIFEFAQGKETSLKILGGILENRFLTSDEVIALAKIPGREALYGALVRTLYAPVQGFAATLNEIPSSLVRVLSEVTRVRA